MTSPQPPRAARRAMQQRSRPSEEELARLRAEKAARRAAEGKVAGPAQTPPTPKAEVKPHDPLQGARVKAKDAWFTPGQKKQLKLILPAAAALTYAANRNTDKRVKVGKREERDNRRVAAGAAGGAGLAYAADTVTGAGLKQLANAQRKRFKAKRTPEEYAAVNRAQNEHGGKFGLTDSRGRGRILNPATDQEILSNRSKNTYFRTYPLKTTAEHGVAGLRVPGAIAHRINSHRDLKLKSVLAGGAVLGGGAAAKHREPVRKADRNDAALAYGAGALTAAANYNMPERVWRSRQARKLTAAQRGWDEAKAAPKGPEWKTNVKAAQGRYQDVKGAAKTAKPPLSLKGKLSILGGGIATGVPALYVGGRGKVEKYDRKDYNRDFAAGAAGASLPMIAAAGTKKIDRHYMKQVQANPEFLARHNAHREAHGSPPKFGDSRWNKLYENYPKDLPGGRYRRVAARTLAGKGLPVTMAATGGAGILATRRATKVEKKDAAQGFNVLRWANNHKKAIGIPAGIAAAAGTQGGRQGGGHRKEQAAAAAVGGQAAFRATGYGALKIADRQDRQAMKHGWQGEAYTRSRANKYKSQARRAAGLTDNPRTHQERALMARHTPLDAPGARARRLAGHMAGKQGWAINVASTAGPAALVLSKKPVEKAEHAFVGKAVTYGYQEKRRSNFRTAEMAAGGLGVAYGVSRIPVGNQVRRGIKYAEGKGYGPEARGVAEAARRGRNAVRSGTGQAVSQIRRIPGMGTALDLVPAKMRPHAAIAGGALLAARAHPTHDERFVPTGRF